MYVYTYTYMQTHTHKLHLWNLLLCNPRHRSSKIIGFDVSFILGIESKKATTKNEHMCLIIIIVCVMISIFECYTKILFLRKWIMVMLYDVKSASMFSAISEECSIFCSSSNWSILLLSVLRLLSKLRLLSTSFLNPKMNAKDKSGNEKLVLFSLTHEKPDRRRKKQEV